MPVVSRSESGVLEAVFTETTVPVRQRALSGIWKRGLTVAQTLLNGSMLSRETAQMVLEHVVPTVCYRLVPLGCALDRL